MGPVIHGRPISSAPTVGPHSRTASEMTATRIGGTAILRRKSMVNSPPCVIPAERSERRESSRKSDREDSTSIPALRFAWRE